MFTRHRHPTDQEATPDLATRAKALVANALKPNRVRLAEQALAAARADRATLSDKLQAQIAERRNRAAGGLQSMPAELRAIESQVTALDQQIRGLREQLASKRADWAPQVGVEFAALLAEGSTELEAMALRIAQWNEAIHTLRTFAQFNGIELPGVPMVPINTTGIEQTSRGLARYHEVSAASVKAAE